MKKIEGTRWKVIAPIMATMIGMLSSAALVPSPASGAATVHCQPVVKNFPSFYKAKVLIVHGPVSCPDARRILWRALRPGGFNGGLSGWKCESKGALDPFVEKCTREAPTSGEREVIKTSKPKPCPRCEANEH